MLQFAWTAWQHGDSLVWLAEQEGRLEYDAPIALSDDPRMHGSHPSRAAGGRRSRRLGPIYLLRRPYFLPDARGEYITVEERFPFALEVDRSYNRDAALWDKFRRYAVALEKKTGDYQGYRLLLVTTGWRHAERLVRLARQLFGFSFDRDEASSEEEANARLARHMLPLFVTTFRAVHSQSASGPIWWNAVSNRRDEYCFPGLAETMESGKGEGEGEEGREREGRKK